MLQRKAEPNMAMGAGFLGHFASILCMQNAGHPRREKSPVSASSQESPKFEDVAANLRRLFGSRGGSILVTEDARGPL